MTNLMPDSLRQTENNSVSQKKSGTRYKITKKTYRMINNSMLPLFIQVQN